MNPQGRWMVVGGWGRKMVILPFDRDEIRERFINARPFPFVKIDGFLDPSFAAEVASAYPSFEDATHQGKSFKTVNERKKVQVTDAGLFPVAISKLNEALASDEFLYDLSHITDIPNLVADEKLTGGGIHITGPGGRLDVHVDFNYIADRSLYRRVNLLLYLNPVWEEKWGGHIQLWDKEVKSCQCSFSPVMNRCVIFETSEISFHGVTPVTADARFPRMSFATYYYTRERPANWSGGMHSTVFKARPEEFYRGYLLMPAELMQRKLTSGVHYIKRGLKRFVSPDR
jgi:hypothetical protein